MRTLAHSTVIVLALLLLFALGLSGSSSTLTADQSTPTPSVVRPTSPDARPGTGGFVYTGLSQRNDNEPDVLLLALLTVGAAGVATFVSLIGYAIRQRVGFWLHRPPPRDASETEDHH